MFKKKIARPLQFRRPLAHALGPLGCYSFLSPARARLAQSVEHETLNLRVVGSSPTLGGEGFLQVLFWGCLPCCRGKQPVISLYPFTQGDVAQW